MTYSIYIIYNNNYILFYKQTLNSLQVHYSKKPELWNIMEFLLKYFFCDTSLDVTGTMCTP